ncbi:enoyl-CoA hydratase-related protein [Micromonospora sp. NPDC047467]|uniref:enoyl-CoA hydratase/isomerase family protein n=1 Tax=Micromonospora sp. NPDC047467 TaxID=3154814 RepID=UPI0033E534E7
MVQVYEAGDPGAGERLGPAARATLGDALKRHARTPGQPLLIRVEGDAWCHEPDDLTQPVVRGQLHELVLRVHAAPGPVIVQLAGAVRGLGLGLALAADLRVAAPTASFAVGSPAAFLAGGVGQLLAGVVGTGVLAQMAWTGATLTADEALHRGMVGSVTADPQAGAALAAQVATIGAGTASALARALRGRDRPDLTAALDYESWLAGVE